MSELLSYAFMQNAILEAILIGTLCAVIGVYIVLNGLSFIGAGISHAAFGGVALGFATGINPVLSALAFCIAVALGIGGISERAGLRHDTAVGIFFAATMAFGVFLLSIIDGVYVDIFSYLFGNILAIGTDDLVIGGVAVAVVLGAVLLLYKEFLALSFDYEMAEATGIPVRKLYYLLLVLIAITVVVSVKAIGIVLVASLLITPAATAYQLTNRFGVMMLLSVVFGVGSSITGLMLSYAWDIPSGATIVLVTTVVFFVVWLIGPSKGAIVRLFRRTPPLESAAIPE